MTSPDANTATDLARVMAPAALALLGEPSERHHNGQEWRYGTRGSLSVRVDQGTWYDNEAGKGGGTLDLVRSRKGLSKEEALKWLRDKKLIESTPAARKIIATYDYRATDGVLLFQVVRFEPKDFRQRRPDDRGGWVWKMGGVPRVPFRLPELLAAIAAGQTIYIAEGEKGVGALEFIGLAATCSPGGAGKWQPAYSEHFAGADVVILPDNDNPGRAHAEQVAGALRSVARSIRVLPLPGLPLKGDVADWIVAGGTAAKLQELAEAAAALEGPANDADQTAGTDTADKAASDIARLAALSRVAYDLCRASEADRLGIRVSTLDAEVEKLRAAKTSRAQQSADLTNDDGIITEDAVALAFTNAHRDDLRFCHHAGAWYRWNGSIWQREETKLAFSWARATARKLAKQSGDAKAISTAGKAAFAAGVERFAQADRAFAVTSARWDTDPWLLGTPAGTVDLRTGEMRPARQTDHITRSTAVTPAPTADCPQWLKFLDQATAGDPALVGFLRRWLGYCLTGDTREHALLFVYGHGGNGKGVLLNTAAGILGSYATTTAMDTFTASQSDRHPTDLAMLRGARLAMTTETEEGRAWAEARIKALTGGDPISARFMRQDFFTFTPAFKLTISGNHKPTLRNVDDAARRRFNIVPFMHKPAQPDKTLPERFKTEWPAILQWMICGCLEWQRHGLNPPKAVTDATAEYFSEQDSIRQWIEECCDIEGRNLADTTDALFKSWTAYALASGEKPGTTKWFSQNLIRQGFKSVPEVTGHRKKRGFEGIAMKLPPAGKPHHEPNEPESAWPW